LWIEKTGRENVTKRYMPEFFFFSHSHVKKYTNYILEELEKNLLYNWKKGHQAKTCY